MPGEDQMDEMRDLAEATADVTKEALEDVKEQSEKIDELKKKVEEMKDRAQDAPEMKRLQVQQSDPIVGFIDNFWEKLRSGELGDTIEISRLDLQALIMDNQKHRRNAEAETGPLDAGTMLSLSHDRLAGGIDALTSCVRTILGQVQWLTNVVNQSGILDGPDYFGIGRQVNLLRAACLDAGIIPDENAFLYREELRTDGGEEGDEEEGPQDDAAGDDCGVGGDDEAPAES